MKKYAILLNPGHNRVYFDASLALSLCEFGVLVNGLTALPQDIRIEDIGGVRYVVFNAANNLTDNDTVAIFGLSFLYALFEVSEDGGGLFLHPVSPAKQAFINDQMGSMLKYTGKTNEIFTKMLINLAYYSQEARGSVNLLDPLCGKGTTLYEGLAKGLNVYGIELSETLVHESYHFVKRFFESERYKFEHHALKISGPNNLFKAQKHTFEIAPSKEDEKTGNTRTLAIAAGNAVYADAMYKKKFFDIIVADLPYGVMHGSVGGVEKKKSRNSSLTRNPEELLAACLPSWAAALKTGGACAVAWNVHVLPRERVCQLFEDAGFSVLCGEGYDRLKHRVDQAILRDVVVARKG